MESGSILLLSTYLKKWSYQDNRLTISFSFYTDAGYGRAHVDLRISYPQVLLNEFLNGALTKIREAVQNSDIPLSMLRFHNEAEVHRKISLYISKILKEFNTNKRSNGRVRMISSRSMDFYYNDFDYEALEDDLKFYVHLNRGVNKINGDLWSAAIDDLTKALQFNSEHPLVNKYMAQALTEEGRNNEALQYLQKYSDSDTSNTSTFDLAKAFLRENKFDEAAEILDKIAEADPENLYARVGKAQLAYLSGKSYLSMLDKIYKDDDVWLVEYLRKEWEYKQPGNGDDESRMWNAAAAARYLGFDRPFDLTKRAFNNEIPCYFDADRGTIRFVKTELDSWISLQNRYHIDGVEYEAHEERLTENEMKIARMRRGRKTSADDVPAEEKAVG